MQGRTKFLELQSVQKLSLVITPERYPPFN